MIKRNIILAIFTLFVTFGFCNMAMAKPKPNADASALQSKVPSLPSDIAPDEEAASEKVTNARQKHPLDTEQQAKDVQDMLDDAKKMQEQKQQQLDEATKIYKDNNQVDDFNPDEILNKKLPALPED